MREGREGGREGGRERELLWGLGDGAVDVGVPRRELVQRVAAATGVRGEGVGGGTHVDLAELLRGVAGRIVCMSW